MRGALLTAVAMAGLVAAGCGDQSSKSVTTVVTVTRTTTTAASPSTSTSAPRGASTADVVARVLPGVVNVRTVGFNGNQGEGSGVVIDRRGVILTNNHVIRGARKVTVSFNDGRHKSAVKGTVIGTAAKRDLAIIRVALSDLIPVPLGHSSQARLGDGVLAIGFPLDLGGGPTVTQGIVSGLHRTVHAEDGPISRAAPDGRRDQPGQLRRGARRLDGQADRHQHHRRERTPRTSASRSRSTAPAR